MTEALIDALANTLSLVKAKRLSDRVADGKDESLLHSLADKIAEVEAETLYEILSEMKITVHCTRH